MHDVNDLHAIKDHPSLVHLSTRDVIHSFNFNPHLHIKQDALPGKVIPVWFIPIKSNTKFNEKTKRWEQIAQSGTSPVPNCAAGAIIAWSAGCSCMRPRTTFSNGWSTHEDLENEGRVKKQ